MILITKLTNHLSLPKSSTNYYHDIEDLICLMACANLIDDVSTFVISLVALIALANREPDTWYMDSGCSRHMTGNKNCL